jgi:ATP-dependent DNA helicase RecQ
LEGHPYPELFERLRALRKRLADERGIPPYVIFHDTTLKHMAAMLPVSYEDLLRIPGVGQQKALDYGRIFLDDVAAYAKQSGAKPKPLEVTARKRLTRSNLNDSTLTSVSLYRAGHNIEEIADVRGFARTTIEGHLADALEAGEELDLGRLIDSRRRHAIETVMDEIGWEMMKPVMERLGDGYSYTELRLVRAAYRSRIQESY